MQTGKKGSNQNCFKKKYNNHYNLFSRKINLV